ncbi:MAG TPA: DMT family transporter [Candidatus Limnocylindrales bacterium]|nr:DMT family transporter [Candidatus Limnocylindrales bacterium]
MQTSGWTGKRAKAVFLTILAGVLWGTSFPAIKIGLSYVDTYLFVFLRFLLASALMLLIMVSAKKITFPVKEKKLILFLGIANGAAYLLQYVGMTSASATVAALFINLSAVWVALLSPRLQGETLGRRKILGVLAALTGVIFVTTNLDFSMLNGQLIGDLLLVTSGIVWAFFIIYNKDLVMKSHNTLQSLTWVLPVTLLPMVPFALPSANEVTALPIQAWLAIVYTAVMCWIVPYYLWLEGLKHISASTSTILLLSEILVATAISYVLLNETLTLISVVGASLIVIAIVLVSYRSE